MRIFPWRCAFTSPQYFTFSLLSIQLFTFTLFFFLKLGTLFQPNDNISMLFCCHRTNLPLTLPIFLTPHIFCNSLCICIFPAFVFLPPFVFLSGQLSRQQGLYLCLLWEPGCLLAFSILAHQHSQRGILILRGQHLFPPKNRKFNEQEVQIYAHSNLHKCPTIQMRLFKCLEIKSIDSVESFSYAAKCIGKQLTDSNWSKTYFFLFFSSFYVVIILDLEF